mgnify:CR=1 FL=1
MNYQSELNFVRELLRTYRLTIYLFDDDTTPDMVIPEYGWIGELLTKDATLSNIYSQFRNQCKPNIVYQIDDGFLCHHIVFLLPTEDRKTTFAYIGPYTQELIGKQHITKLTERYHFSPTLISKIESYYQEVPYLADETHLLSIIYTFCSHIWGGTDKFTTKHFQDFYPINFDSVLKYSGKETLDSAQDILYLEERYDVERQLMQAVSIGQIPKAELLFATLSKYQFEARSTNALRNMKNYLIILNTLLRVAVRNGDVPPFHIDKLSSAYAHKIEATTSTNAGMALMKEMVRKYCLLVKNHSMKGYSLLIRKVLTQIDYDLTADLGLKNLAAQLNVNPSYLSTLFKKETGFTLTEYVNQKRVEHAVFLLNSSSLQIQMIAQYSGIPDVNYFTKTFKKIIGITPKEYRDHISAPF